MSPLRVVILSGGLDSATALGIACGDALHSLNIDKESVNLAGRSNVEAISFDYGQKHRVELDCAAGLCQHYGVRHTVVKLNPDPFRGGVLTTDAPVPDMRYDDLPDGVMSPTYVPFRNGNLISMAAAYADSRLREEVVGMSTGPDPHPGEPKWEDTLLYCGMHSEDAAGFAYADCTPEFLGAMAAAVHIGTYGRVRLHALFQHMMKVEIIRKGTAIKVPYQMTHSCYKGERPACGQCSTCNARLDAFQLAGIIDPLEYS